MTSSGATGTWTVPEAVAAALVDLGARRFFGLMGDDTAAIAVHAAERGLAYVDARHENAAVAMAAAYSRTAGELGVCVLSRGPGLTNALTAVVNANRGDAAVLVIVGDTWARPPRNSVLLPDYKAIDLDALTAALDVTMFRPSGPESVTQTLADAAAAAAAGRTVLFALPRDLLAGETPSSRLPPLAAPERPRPAARRAAVTVAASVLAAAEHPVIVAGHGAWRSGARDELVELAARSGAALATSLRAKDMFAGHPLDVGLIGSFSAAPCRRALEKADCLLVVGAGLNRFSTASGAGLPEVPLIQVDLDRQHIGRTFWADVALVGDARTVVTQLLDALAGRDRAGSGFADGALAADIASYDPRSEYQDASTKWTCDPRALVLTLDRLLPRDRAVVTDVGNFFGLVPQHLTVPDPDRFMLSSDFSAIGLGFGSALGAAVARPGACTVLFIGDGGLLMSLGELESLARHQLPVVVVVVNDGGYGAERHYLGARQHSERLANSPSSDFAEFAAALGLEAHTVRSIDDLEALAPVLTAPSGPVLVDCRVSPDVIAPFLAGG